MKKILILMVIFPFVVFSQNSDKAVNADFKTLYIRLDSLESHVKSEKNALENAEKAIIKSNDLIDLSKDYIIKSDNLINRFFNLYAIVIGIVSFTGGLFYFFIVKQVINKKVDDKIEKELKEESSTLKNTIKKQQQEDDVLLNSNILILNKSDTSVNQYLLKVLIRFSKNTDIINIDNLHEFSFKNIDIVKYDLVLFDNTNTENETKNWDFRFLKSKDDDSEETKNNTSIQNELNKMNKNKLIEIAKEACIKDVAFLFFGINDDKFTEKLPHYLHLINYSNSPSTIFSNVVNLLTFRKLLSN